MVCRKDQIYNWFKTLDGAKRIDFLSGLLQLCFPLELRFIGSCIEELARKDYNYLRDAEIKANTVQDILTMQDISEKVTRSKMIVTLALLTSTNQECARLLYNILKIDIVNILDNTKCLDEIIADEYLLLLTMASNHPSFDFIMKNVMNEQLKRAELKLKNENILKRDSFNDFCFVNGESEANTQTNADDLCQSNVVTTTTTIINNDNNTNVNKSHFYLDTDTDETDGGNGKCSADEGNCDDDDDDDDVVSEHETQMSVSQITTVNKNVFIKLIHFEGVKNIPGTDVYKFLIKIHWSDDEVRKIGKTFLEIYEFHKQLIKNYQNDLNGSLKEDELEFNENKKEDFVKELPMVTQYCSKILSLPEKVLHTNFVTEFFRSGEYDEADVDVNTTLTQNLSKSEVVSPLRKKPASMQQSDAELVKKEEQPQTITSSTTENDDKTIKSPMQKQLSQTNSVLNNVNTQDNHSIMNNRVQLDYRHLSRSSLTSPCPSPIQFINQPNQNTNNNSRSNSPATQQRLPPRPFNTQSPLLTPQFGHIQQQYLQHQAEMAYNLQKSTFIPNNQSKLRTASNQNEDYLSKSIDSENLTQLLNEHKQRGVQQQQLTENLNSPKTTQMMSMQMPPPPPPPLPPGKYTPVYNMMPPTNDNQQLLQPFTIQYPYSIPYSMHHQIRFPLDNLTYTPQQLIQPLIQSNVMNTTTTTTTSTTTTSSRLTNGGGGNYASSSESNSPPTSQSPESTLTQSSQQQTNNSSQYNKRNKSTLPNEVVQSDDDRDQKYRKQNKVPMLTKQNSLPVNTHNDNKRNNNNNHFPQLSQYQYPPIPQQPQSQQYIPVSYPSMQHQIFYSERPALFSNTPPPPPPPQSTQPIGINVNTTYQDRGNTATPPISNNDLKSKQSQPMIFPISPLPQAQIKPTTTNESQQKQNIKHMLPPLPPQAAAPVATAATTTTTQNKPINKNLIHSNNETTQSLPDMSNLILLNQNNRTTPSPNYLEVNPNMKPQQGQQFIPQYINSPTPNSTFSQSIGNGNNNFLNNNNNNNTTNGANVQYIDFNEAVLNNGGVMSMSMPAQTSDMSSNTNKQQFMPIQAPMYLNLIPIMTGSNGSLQPPQHMPQPPPGAFFFNANQQNFMQQPPPPPPPQSTSAPNTTTTTITTQTNDYQNGANQTTKQVNMDQQFFDNFNLYQLTQLMANANSNLNLMNGQNCNNTNNSKSYNLLHNQKMPHQHQHQQQQQHHGGSKYNSNNNLRKKSCFNCGSMTHMASDCKELTLENMSQSATFRLNFKPTQNGVSSNSTEPNKTIQNNNNNNNNSMTDMNKLKNVSDTNILKPQIETNQYQKNENKPLN